MKRVSKTACPASHSLVSSSCPLMKNMSKSSEPLSCSRTTYGTRNPNLGVSILRNLSCKIFQAFAPSPMPKSCTHSCLIRMNVLASRLSDRLHHTMFNFSLMSSHMHSVSLSGLSQHCLLHLPVVQAHCVSPPFPVVICRGPLSASPTNTYRVLLIGKSCAFPE